MQPRDALLYAAIVTLTGIGMSLLFILCTVLARLVNSV